LSSFAAHVTVNLRKVVLNCFNLTLLKRVALFIHTSALLIWCSTFKMWAG